MDRLGRNAFKARGIVFRNMARRFVGDLELERVAYWQTPLLPRGGAADGCTHFALAHCSPPRHAAPTLPFGRQVPTTCDLSPPYAWVRGKSPFALATPGSQNDAAPHAVSGVL